MKLDADAKLKIVNSYQRAKDHSVVVDHLLDWPLNFRFLTDWNSWICTGFHVSEEYLCRRLKSGKIRKDTHLARTKDEALEKWMQLYDSPSIEEMALWLEIAGR